MPSSKGKCGCAEQFEVRLLRAADYREAKRVFDRGDHPTFIGRNMFSLNAENGGALLFLWRSEPAAVALLNPRLGSLLALNVLPQHRGHGLGGALLAYLQPNFVRALDTAAPWFAARGYQPVGAPKQGRRLKTQVMMRSRLLELAGRLNRAWGGQ